MHPLSLFWRAHSTAPTLRISSPYRIHIAMAGQSGGTSQSVTNSSKRKKFPAILSIRASVQIAGIGGADKPAIRRIILGPAYQEPDVRPVRQSPLRHALQLRCIQDRGGPKRSKMHHPSKGQCASPSRVDIQRFLAETSP